MANVVFETVTKQYDNGFVAVKDLNLEIGDREFLVLVGPSGCGKTTSLRMLAGLEAISQGSVYIGGQRVNDLPPKDRDIAMVFQSYALYPHMSVFENMAFSLQLQGVAKAEIRERVQRAAQQLGIEVLLDRKPKQLSGGQRQRVAVGRAIVRREREREREREERSVHFVFCPSAAFGAAVTKAFPPGLPELRTPEAK
ncbi:MAG: ATP-binding cassette domain-containing protein, partial [Cyanobacteria bacterium P01_H01_bin.121]